MDNIQEIGALLADFADDAAYRVLERLKEADCQAVIPPKRIVNKAENMTRRCISGGI